MIALDKATGLPIASARPVDPKWLNANGVPDFFGVLGRGEGGSIEAQLASSAWLEDMHEAEDLQYMLREGAAQTVALKALGAELHEPEVMTQYVALIVEPLIGLAGRGDIPVARAADVERIIGAIAREIEPLERWHWALEAVFRFQWSSMREGPPSEQVDRLLEVLRGATPDLPRRFREPLAAHKREAARFLGGLRLSLGKKPARGSLSPWGAAKRFATAFGVPFPRNRYEATRDHKAKSDRR